MKRFISLFLVLVLTLSFTSTVAFAESSNPKLTDTYGGIYSDSIPSEANDYVAENYTYILEVVKDNLPLFDLEPQQLENIYIGNPYTIYNINNDSENEIYYYPIVDRSNDEIVMIINIVGTTNGWSMSVDQNFVEQLNKMDFLNNDYILYADEDATVAENNKESVLISGIKTAKMKKYEKYNADFIRDDDGNIYLTFDEGYENRYTEKILDVLKEKQAPAVFFVTYDYAKRNPQLIKRMIDEGHIVGNHSYSHPSMPSMSLSEAAEDVKKLHDYIKEEFGYTMTLFRFPKGEFSEQCLALLNEMGYKSVFWSFAYQDWNADNQPDPDQSLKKLSESIHSGGIYLLHAVSSTNAEILGDFIDTVRENGLKTAKYE